MAGALEIRGLHVALTLGRNAPQTTLLDGVDLTLAPGRRLALVGESGSGKSLTAAALIGLIDAPLSWRADTFRLGDVDLNCLDDRQWRDVRGASISLVQQDPLTALSPVFAVGTQIAETITRHLGMKGQAAWDEAIARMEEVGIPDSPRRAHDYPHQLSGGLRQRVAIAIALAAAPSVVLADEPTTALDVTVQRQILDLLRRMSEERHTSLLLITHDLHLIADFAHDVAVMYAGRIAETGPASLLLDKPKHPYTAALMAAQPGQNPHAAKRRLPTIAGQPPVPADRPEGCAFAARCPLAIALCHQSRPLLRWVEGREVACHRAELTPPLEARE